MPRGLPRKTGFSTTGHGIRPIEALSHNRVSRDVCEQRLEAAQPPGTLCFVHEVGRHNGANDPPHARYGVVVRMEKDVAVFESMRKDGRPVTEFRSKNFKPIPLRAGVSAKQFVGIPVDHDALARACFPSISTDSGPTIIELSDLDDTTAVRLPVISGIDSGHCDEMPNIITVDKSGRVWRPSGDGQFLHPTDDYNYTVAANNRSAESPQARIDRLMDDLYHRPNMFDGAIIHKLYSDIGIVFKGAEELLLATAGAAELLLTAAGAEEPSLAGMPQVTAGVAMSPPSSSAAGSWEAATSPVDDQSEEPSDIKLELLLPRKLKTYDGGWSSDDTKTFDKDRGTEGNTHTHTHCSLFGKVVSFLL
jgi:hypothetical protein